MSKMHIVPCNGAVFASISYRRPGEIILARQDFTSLAVNALVLLARGRIFPNPQGTADDSPPGGGGIFPNPQGTADDSPLTISGTTHRNG